MEIIPVESGPVETIGYLVFDETSGKGLIIDAPMESSEIFLRLLSERNIELTGILLTHSHWDHTAEAAIIHRKTGAAIMSHKADEYRLTDPNGTSVFTLPFELEPVAVNKYINDGEKIICGSIELEVLHTPGHTEGGVCFVDYSQKLLFSGDTIFMGSVGRVDLPGGNMTVLMESIQSKIMSLPDDFIIYCGHGPSTTVGEERINNPFLNKSYNW